MGVFKMKRKNLKSILKLGLAVIFMISVLYSSFGGVYAAYEPSKAAKINSFTSSATSIKSGNSVVLSWNVSNASSIEILGLEKAPESELPLVGSLEVWPTASTSYVLMAYSDGGNASKTVTVNVDAVGNVNIDYFNASATEIPADTSVTLSWKASNAVSISIIGLEKEPESALPLTGTLEVWPTKSTSYVLQAVGLNGELATKTITVNIVAKKPAVINSFTASPAQINKGSSSTLSWNVSNATSISIKSVKSGLAATGSLSVTPTQTTTYVLEAIGQDGKTVTSSITVKVVASTLQITSFTASSTIVSRGTLVTLSWTTQNATTCKIVTSAGQTLSNRPVNGSISVTPNATTTYTLTATDANQTTVQKSITITVK